MRKFLRVTLQIAAVLIVLGVLGRLLLFKAWTIPDPDQTGDDKDAWTSASIAPTLRGGDTVLVLFRGTPGFGDLVRCPDPEEPGRWVIGRIVGVEGDTVEVENHILRVNNTTYTSTEACKKSTFTVEHPQTGSEVDMVCARLDLGGDWHYRGYTRHRRTTSRKKHTVGTGRVFLLSDNIDIHDDSRDYGAVQADLCTERIVFRLWGKNGWTDSENRLTVIR